MKDNMTPADLLELQRELDTHDWMKESKARWEAAQAAKQEEAQQLQKEVQRRLDALPPDERKAVLESLARQKAAAAAYEKKVRTGAAKPGPMPSRAPAPIEPLRGSGHLPPRVRPSPPLPEKVVRGGFIPPASLAQPARWQVWRHTPARPLWECVALSLNMEPTDRVREEARRGRGTYSRLPGEYWDRLTVCQANLSLDGPIHPQGGLYMGMLRDVGCQVLMAEVAAFLTGADFDVPEEMRDLAPPRPQPQAPQSALAVTAAPGVQHRASRRADPLDPVLELARNRALDASSWPSVWDALVVLAQSPDRPAPLLGYTEGEGVKWQADDEAEPVRYLTRENLRDRWRRRI